MRAPAGEGTPSRVDVLLVGGGVASVRCARTLRRNGFTGSILLVADERVLPYNRPPLSKELLRDDLPEELALAERDAWYARQSVEVLTGETVTELDVAARTAELWDGRRIEYGKCLLATGAAPRTLPVPGGAAVPVLRTLADARRLRATASAAKGTLAIAGGGLIGVEVASSLAALGLRPVVLVREGRLWSGSLGESLSTWAVDRLVDAGIDVRLGTEVTEVIDGRPRTTAGDVDAPLVLAGVGVTPRSGVAESAGLDVDDGIVTDADGRTSDDAIWAAGDVARRAGRRFEHWHAAREGGERAARSMLGLEAEPERAPWLFSEIAGHTLDVFGESSSDEEVWLRDEGVLAYVDTGRVVGLAVIDAAMAAERARGLVDSPFDEVASALA